MIMSEITEETVRKIARLSRIKLKDTEIGSVIDKLNKVISWTDKLFEVNTDHVETCDTVFIDKAVLREDQITDGGYADQIVSCSPHAADHFFTVPKVIE